MRLVNEIRFEIVGKFFNLLWPVNKLVYQGTNLAQNGLDMPLLMSE